MASPDLRERLRRLLLLVPYVAQHQGVPLEELAVFLSMPVEELIGELDFLLMVGQPPFAPDDCVDLRVDDGKVYVDLDQAFHKPPRLTALEALALASAAQGMAEGNDGTIARALARIEAALPPQALSLYRELVRRFAVARQPGEAEAAALLRQAIAERQEVELDYWAESRGEVTVRPVRPRELRWAQGHFYLSAFCLTRGDDRSFRVDRVRSARLTGRHFEPLPPERRAARAPGEPPAPPPGTAEERPRLRLRGGSALRYAEERFGAAAVTREGADVGAVALNGPADAWTVSFMLSFAGAAELVEPPELREAARERIEKTLARYR
ncbi:MAG: WYL domain-containing transcriptional regulator [Deltaproteobacteria bacterium]